MIRNTETHPPVGQVEGKKEKIESMFDAIASRYDFLNRVLSAGIDKRWRKNAIALLKKEHPKRILDVATGTADLALATLHLDPDEVIGVDIAEEMLKVGREKIASKGVENKITLQRGDSENLPFENNYFDAVLVAFGVRNFENLHKGLSEMNRVLKPNGSLVVLEFSKPRKFPIKQGYNFYFKYILPTVGRIVSGVSGPYSYLPASVKEFPDGDDFLNEMKKAGFTSVAQHVQTFGIATIYKGQAS